jgi:hypothetical protein
MPANPYLLDDLLAEDGVDLDSWQLRRSATAEGENPAVHVAHSDCQRGHEWLIAWCGVALDWSGRRDAEPSEDEGRELCDACVARSGPSPGCPCCGIAVDAL